MTGNLARRLGRLEAAAAQGAGPIPMRLTTDVVYRLPVEVLRVLVAEADGEPVDLSDEQAARMQAEIDAAVNACKRG